MPPPAQNSTCKTFCLFVSGFTRHIYEGLVSTHGSSLQFWHFPIYGENACVLEGRHGGLVGTKALGEEIGPCLLYGYDYDYGFVFGFLRLILQASGCCRRDFPQGLLF